MPQDQMQKKHHEEEASAQPTPNAELAKEGKELKEDIDKVLDEIDEMLKEEGAEEFAENYVQRGGE